MQRDFSWDMSRKQSKWSRKWANPWPEWSRKQESLAWFRVHEHTPKGLRSNGFPFYTQEGRETASLEFRFSLGLMKKLIEAI